MRRRCSSRIASFAQRHFNAVAFAAFLRELDGSGRLPEEEAGGIRLEGFLPSEARATLPKTWRKREATVFDFPSWMSGRTGRELFHTIDDNAMVATLGGLDAAKSPRA